MSDTLAYLVRHAEAGEPARWSRADRERSLTEQGRRQSEALVDRLRGTPLAHLISSPFLRCIQTLEPLSAARGLDIETRDELAEGAPKAYVEKILLEAASDGPTVLSVHGDGMRFLLRELFDRDVPIKREPRDDAKGSMWVLGVREGAIVSARFMPPP